jgi:hypothetical protein
MKRLFLAFALLGVAAGAASAATVVNTDTTSQTIVVTEGSNRTELTIAPGEQAEFCPNSCFVTFPNGDREALTGAETIEIKGGAGRIK